MERLVYGIVGNSLVFIPIDHAEELATIHRTLNSSKTWGEFKSQLPSGAYEEVLELIDGDEPGGKEPFSLDAIPAATDGDWPGWPAQEMLSWVPEKIQERFGSTEPTLFNGGCLTLDVDREREIVMAFERMGYEVWNDDVLVNRASGQWVNDDYKRSSRPMIANERQLPLDLPPTDES